MKKRNAVIYSILIILALSVLFAVVANRVNKGKASDNDDPKPQQTQTVNTTPKPTPTPEESAKITEAPEGYFDDALFIGDSRTVGLSEFGGLDGATFFCSVGLNLYKMDSETINGSTLAGILQSKQFGKVYISTGINELGYDRATTLSKYQSLIDKIRSAQPDAIIIIHGVIHVAQSLSDTSNVFKNSDINSFNESIKAYADDKTIFYIDANEHFDDANGNLGSEYTSDNVHFLGKYYGEWAEWVKDNAVVK